MFEFTFLDFLKTFLGLFLIIAGRYFFVSGVFFWYLWKKKHPFQPLQKLEPAPARVRSEICWSMMTSLLFALPSAVMIESWKAGGTLIYSDIHQYGWLYTVGSFFVYLFLHDTYFYWTHVWMHAKPKRFMRFHQVHHQSLDPTPWTAFSFHPFEGMIEAIIIPLMVFVIPIHIGALLLMLTLMTFFGVVNHCGFEVYPKSWMNSWWGKWMITPSHHNHHHKRFNTNYGLYFRFWDYWMKTDDGYSKLVPSKVKA